MRVPHNKGQRTGRTRPCIVCGTLFYKPPSQNHIKYCSQTCYHSIPSNHAKNTGKHWKNSEETKERMSIRQRREKNHNWKGGITDPRRSAVNKRWKRAVIKKYSSVCVVCEEKGTVAHHLNSYSKYIKSRFDVDNGICLCIECHKKFHKLYGYGNNTAQQFVRYLKDEINESIISKERVGSSSYCLQY